jgi:hypothetical protein
MRSVPAPARQVGPHEPAGIQCDEFGLWRLYLAEWPLSMITAQARSRGQAAAHQRMVIDQQEFDAFFHFVRLRCFFGVAVRQRRLYVSSQSARRQTCNYNRGNSRRRFRNQWFSFHI